MSAVFSTERPASSTLKLNSMPQQKFWFDPSATRPTLEAERRHRQERLAGAFRLFARHGFDLGLAGHITARDPELTDHFWINPLGMHFPRIGVSDLLLVNAHDEVVIGNWPLNKAAFTIHAAIYEAHPHIVAAAYTRSIYSKAWSTLGRPLGPLTQNMCSFYEDHTLFDGFTDMVADSNEGKRIAYILTKPDGDMYRGVILKNHGILTADPTAETTTWWYIALDSTAYTQLLAEATGVP